MKKTTIYRVLTTVDFLILAIFWLFTILGVVKVDFKTIWFSSLLTAIALALFLKYFLFKSDNILWFAIYLMFVAIFNYVSFVFGIGEKFFPVYILLGAIDSLILAIIFRSLWQICLFVMLAFVGAPLFLISFSIIEWWWFLAVYVVALIVGVCCVGFVYNFVESRYGKV